MSEEVRRALARLAADDDPVERADRALRDLEAAVAFVEGGGLGELRAAIGRAAASDEAERAARGRAALAAFEELRRAADGDHFRPDHHTDLSRPAEPDTG